jgi:hypothetical protein
MPVGSGHSSPQRLDNNDQGQNENESRLLVLQGFIHRDFVAPAHCDDFVNGSVAA